MKQILGARTIRDITCRLHKDHVGYKCDPTECLVLKTQELSDRKRDNGAFS